MKKIYSITIAILMMLSLNLTTNHECNLILNNNYFTSYEIFPIPHADKTLPQV